MIEPSEAHQREAHLRRLRHVEGQARQLRRMVADDHVPSIDGVAEALAAVVRLARS